MSIHSDLFCKLEAVFRTAKIKEDMFAYYDLANREQVTIYTYNTPENTERVSNYTASDPVTLIAIRVIKRYQGLIYLPYLVEIAVGDYEVSTKTAIDTVSKFKAELFYDENFELITIDYTH